MYDSEEEQVEAIKKWFKRYGNSLLTGLILGLGGITGYQWWNSSNEQNFAQASLAFQSVQELKSELEILVDEKVNELTAENASEDTSESNNDEVVESGESDENVSESVAASPEDDDPTTKIYSDEAIKAKESDFLLATEKLIKDFEDSVYADFATLMRAKHYVEVGLNDLAEQELQQTIQSSKHDIIKELALYRLAGLNMANSDFDQAISLLDKIQSEGYTVMKAESLGDAHFFKQEFDKARDYYQQAVDTGNSAFAQLKLDAINITE